MGEIIHRVSRYIMIQSSRYASWYRKIDEDTYHFCFIHSTILRLLLKSKCIKNSICYMYHSVVVSWNLYQDTYRIVAISYRSTQPKNGASQFNSMGPETHHSKIIVSKCSWTNVDLSSAAFNFTETVLDITYYKVSSRELKCFTELLLYIILQDQFASYML